MESFLPFIIIVVITGLSLLNKLQERKRVEAERQEAEENRSDYEDLPEATRRMVYGDGGPPEARPQPAPPGVRTARPAQPAQRPVPSELDQMPEAFRRIVEALQPELARQAPPKPVQPAPAAPQRPPSPPLRPARQEARRAFPSLEAQSRRPVQPIPPQRVQREQVQRPRPQATRPAKPRPQRRRPVPRPAPVAARGRRRPPPPRGLRLFDDLQDVRRGIVLSEILGPPVSMR